jgi:uncharacterized membrane protein YqaE (UPF0057 family)
MRYLLALFFPWLAFFTMSKVGQGLICLFLQITVLGWIPATLWAFFSISDYNRKLEMDRLIDTIKVSKF